MAQGVLSELVGSSGSIGMARKARKPKANGKTDSENCAILATRAPVLAGQVMLGFSGFQDRVEMKDLVEELKKVAAEVVEGDMSHVERMLATQAIMLDTLFCNLMGRAGLSEQVRHLELYLRLALKAQAQARATAESLAILKNPQPYIRQANIAAGHQQVNNTYAGMPSGKDAHAGESETGQSKLLEAGHEQRLDIGAAAATVRGHQDMAAMGAVNRSGD